MWQFYLLYSTCTYILENPVPCTTHSSLFHMLWCFYKTWKLPSHKLRSLLERSQREPPPILRSDNVHTSSWLYTQQFNTCRLLLLLPRIFAAQTAQEHCVYHGLRVVHRLIGSTHGLGWVGSDWVDFFWYFQWVGLGCRSKKMDLSIGIDKFWHPHPTEFWELNQSSKFCHRWLRSYSFAKFGTNLTPGAKATVQNLSANG